MSSIRDGLTYAEAGVDVDAGNALVRMIKPIARATARRGADAEIGGFGGLFDLKAAGYLDPILVAATDGVGTKLKIAIETASHETVGIDLVAMCVNDLVAQGAEPLFFLDYFACGKLKVETAGEVVRGMAEGCRTAGCGLIGGETAEMPGLYDEGDYDLAGFAVGAAERGHLLPRRDLAAGDVLLGLASSGVHSNGFSLVHRIARDARLDWSAPAPFGTGQTIGQALLEPTRIYAKPILAVIRKTGAIKALAHITGGGLVDNVPRILPQGLAARIELFNLSVPPVFRWLAATGRVAEAEMLRTFNCGVGMVIVVERNAADDVIGALAREGEGAIPLGRLIESATPEVRFVGTLGL